MQDIVHPAALIIFALIHIRFIFRIYLSLWNMVMVSATATDCNVLVQLMIGNGLMGIS